jgi:hypothetical protein
VEMIELLVAFILYYFDAPTIFWIAYCLVLLIQLVRVVLETAVEKAINK